MIPESREADSPSGPGWKGSRSYSNARTGKTDPEKVRKQTRQANTGASIHGFFCRMSRRILSSGMRRIQIPIELIQGNAAQLVDRNEASIFPSIKFGLDLHCQREQDKQSGHSHVQRPRPDLRLLANRLPPSGLSSYALCSACDLI